MPEMVHALFQRTLCKFCGEDIHACSCTVGEEFDVQLMNTSRNLKFPRSVGPLKLVIGASGIAIRTEAKPVQAWSYFELKKWGANKAAMFALDGDAATTGKDRPYIIIQLIQKTSQLHELQLATPQASRIAELMVERASELKTNNRSNGLKIQGRPAGQDATFQKNSDLFSDELYRTAATVAVCGCRVSVRPVILLAACAILGGTFSILCVAVLVAASGGKSRAAAGPGSGDPNLLQAEAAVVELGPCGSNPCRNGAPCVPANSTVAGTHYACTCRIGFVGNICDSIDFCAAQPCLNGGKCRNARDEFECTCSAGFVGPSCETVDHCLSMPCQHQGTCSLSMRGYAYACHCTPGWTGRECEQEDHCSSTPCEHGGECFNVGRSE
eukprot:SAG22_NODE_4079_length_1393_cov_2.047141_1_plen_383_part_01